MEGTEILSQKMGKGCAHLSPETVQHRLGDLGLQSALGLCGQGCAWRHLQRASGPERPALSAALLHVLSAFNQSLSVCSQAFQWGPPGSCGSRTGAQRICISNPLPGTAPHLAKPTSNRTKMGARRGSSCRSGLVFCGACALFGLPWVSLITCRKQVVIVRDPILQMRTLRHTAEVPQTLNHTFHPQSSRWGLLDQLHQWELIRNANSWVPS